MKYDDIELLLKDVTDAGVQGRILEDVAWNFDDNGHTALRIFVLYLKLYMMRNSIFCYQIMYETECEMQIEHDRVTVEQFRNFIYDVMIKSITTAYEDFISFNFDDYRIREWQLRTRDMLQRVKETFS